MSRLTKVLGGGFAVLAVAGAATAAAVAGTRRAEDTIVVAAAPTTSWQPVSVPPPPTTNTFPPPPPYTVPKASVRTGPYSASFDGVVRLRTHQSRGISVGTGFGVGDGTWLLTNAHVIDGGSSIDVEGWDGEILGTARLIGLAPGGDDLALLKLDGLAVKPLTIRAKRATPREELTTAGFPNATRLSRESAVSRFIVPSNGRPVLFLEMQAEHGQSGSPIVDNSDHVVGVLFGGTETGYSLAVPNDVASALLAAHGVPVAPSK